MTTFSRLSISLASLASWRFLLWGRPLPDELSTWIRFGQPHAYRQGNSTAKTPRAPRGEGDVTVGHVLTGMDECVMGFGDEKPGAAVAMLTPLGSEV